MFVGRSLSACILLLAVICFSGVEWCSAGERRSWRPMYDENGKSDFFYQNRKGDGVRLMSDVDKVVEHTMCDFRDSDNWEIYCNGRILEDVNRYKLFSDSKDFVDMPLKNSVGVTRVHYDEIKRSLNANTDNKTLLMQFVNDNFHEVKNDNDVLPPELDKCEISLPPSLQKKIERITDRLYRVWAMDLSRIWLKLCRKMKNDVYNEHELYSLLYVENEFIIPGGRFREFYYWDTYWVVKGLLVSELRDSVRKMIANFGDIIDTHGFVPNGGRVYYSRRSQPPFFIPMVYEYLSQSSEKERQEALADQSLALLERAIAEMKFWESRRNITVKFKGKTYDVFQYRAESNVPRPESFAKDAEAASSIRDPAKRAKFFHNIASAAESGWDFSSRWFVDPADLLTIETTNIIPVDLNAVICWNYNILAYMHYHAKDIPKANFYREKQAKMQKTMSELFYNKETGAWHDFNIRTKRQNTGNIFYASSAFPLFTGCYDDMNPQIVERFFEYAKKMKAIQPGGIATSTFEKKNKKGAEPEQWDYPNGWSPLVHAFIEGLRKSHSIEMQEEAITIAKSWLINNFQPYSQTCQMWEKFNVSTKFATAGRGGEYEPQTGFGWTNGVILDLLYTYRDKVFMSEKPRERDPEHKEECLPIKDKKKEEG